MRSDIPGAGAAHSVEHRVQSQARLDDEHVLVLRPDVAAVRFTGAPDSSGVVAGGAAPAPLDRGHLRDGSPGPEASATPALARRGRAIREIGAGDGAPQAHRRAAAGERPPASADRERRSPRQADPRMPRPAPDRPATTRGPRQTDRDRAPVSTPRSRTPGAERRRSLHRSVPRVDRRQPVSPRRWERSIRSSRLALARCSSLGRRFKSGTIINKIGHLRRLLV